MEEGPGFHKDIAVVAAALVLGPEGAFFLDNALPCLHRGLAHYSNTPTGRRAELHRCDVGMGAELDGDGFLDWVDATGGERQIPRRVEWHGPLEAVVGSVRHQVDHFVLELFLADAAVGGSLTEADSARITVEGVTTAVRQSDLLQAFYDTRGRGLGSISNPSGLLSGLETDDARRIVFDAGIGWLSTLLDELGHGGDHAHEGPCGVLTVRYEATGLPTIAATWAECSLGSGLYMSGTFEAALTAFPTGPFGGQSFSWSVAGEFTLGGAVPRIDLTGVHIVVDSPPGGVGLLRVSGTLVATGGEEGPFQYSVLVDD